MGNWSAWGRNFSGVCLLLLWRSYDSFGYDMGYCEARTVFFGRFPINIAGFVITAAIAFVALVLFPIVPIYKACKKRGV